MERCSTNWCWGVAGGISSVIAGGDFANGFSQGVITAGLNHFALAPARIPSRGANVKGGWRWDY